MSDDNMINRLVPTAPGSIVTWFKKKPFDVVETHRDKDVLTYLSFHLDVYAYICNARPDATFEEQGGELVVIIVQRGTITNRGKMKMTQVSMPISVNGMKSVYVSPTDQPDGDLHKYIIDFNEAKVMFKEQGNSTFEANLAYRDECNRDKYRQYVEARDTVEYWSFEVNNTTSEPIPDRDPIPFFGLSVFSSNTNIPSLNISHSISVRYSQETPSGSMAGKSETMNLNFVYPLPPKDEET